MNVVPCFLTLIDPNKCYQEFIKYRRRRVSYFSIPCTNAYSEVMMQYLLSRRSVNRSREDVENRYCRSHKRVAFWCYYNSFFSWLYGSLGLNTRSLSVPHY